MNKQPPMIKGIMAVFFDIFPTITVFSSMTSSPFTSF